MLLERALHSLTFTSIPKMAEKGKKNGESEKIVTAVLNVDLCCSCIGCIRRIRKACLSLHGVTTVKEDVNSNKVHVSGIFDPVKLKDRLQSSTKKKVELVSPLPPKKDDQKKGDSEAKSKTEQQNNQKSKNEKEPDVTTVVLKMSWHCQGCTHKIHKIISTYKGVLRVQMDKAKELITVNTTSDPKPLVEFLQKKLKRPVQIVPEKKKEKDEEKKQQQQKQEGGKRNGEEETGKDDKAKTKMEYFMVGSGYGCREASSGYVVDVFYDPQIFSEDNPNSCSIM